MEWRCEWCGKPHEEDDPPCDNCGHGSFERAVVPATGSEETLGSESSVWVCTECGREHTKHTPPCSRCGHGELELRRQEIDEEELEVPGYLDLLTPRYVAGLVAVLALAGVFALGVTGIVDVPGFGTDVPQVSDVPGDAATAGNVSFSDAEGAYLDRLNAERTAGSLSRSGRLDEVATFFNQKRVKNATVSREESDRVSEVLDAECQASPRAFSASVAPGSFDSPPELGDALATSYLDEGTAGNATKTGLDMHEAPDGRVYLFQIVC